MNLSSLYRYMNNDKERVKRFLGIFLSEAPKQFKSIQSAMAVNDTDSVNVLSHALKSQCNYLGLDQLAQLAYDIETEAEYGRVNLGNILLLESELMNALHEIQEELSSLSLKTNL